MKILLKRSALDRAISICGESTGEDRHITKATLKRLHGVNFTAATTEVRVVVECLPKIIEGLVPRFRTSINKNTNFRLEPIPRLIQHIRERYLKKPMKIRTCSIRPMALNSQR